MKFKNSILTMAKWDKIKEFMDIKNCSLHYYYYYFFVEECCWSVKLEITFDIKEVAVSFTLICKTYLVKFKNYSKRQRK